MTFFRIFIFLAMAAMTCAAAGHALVTKRDPKGAMGWIALSLVVPVAGPCLYFLFGVNRVETRARKMSASTHRFSHSQNGEYPEAIVENGCSLPAVYDELVRISNTVTRRPLIAGNAFEILHNGEEAYPAMMAAIDAAEHTVYLSSYIFDMDDMGREVTAALERAHHRGVSVRVLVDGIGEFRRFSRASKFFESRGIPVARFIPPRIFPPQLYINLRNHRKILAVDGRVGFTGGMNISMRHMVTDERNRSVVSDMHFLVRGPVIRQMERVFRDDWAFATGEDLAATRGESIHVGTSVSRTIVEGPDEDLDKLFMILVGAVSAARRSVTIMTPYFMPPRGLLAALQAASLKGISVTVVLPSVSDLPFINWATRNMLWELLERGVAVYYQPPPFVHTKLFIVDRHYAQIGSANIDQRSLRLNFEMNLEIYDASFTETISAFTDAAIARSRRISLEDVDGRSLPVRIRDGLSWLFTPYL